MPGSFFSRERHSGFYFDISHAIVPKNRHRNTFLASFRCLRCFAALAFSILCRSRTGVRFDFGSCLKSVKHGDFVGGRDSLPGLFGMIAQ